MKLLARLIFWISGWKISGKWPEGLKKAVLIAIPHTSNWDLIYALSAFYLMEVPAWPSHAVRPSSVPGVMPQDGNPGFIILHLVRKYL